MPVQSVPSLMGITKAPYASFAGKVEAPVAEVFTGFVFGEMVIDEAVVGEIEAAGAVSAILGIDTAVSGGLE